MTGAASANDPALFDRVGLGGDGGEARGHGEGGPASKEVVVAYGFWIFLLSDIIMFAAVFAAYAVLGRATAGGPSGRDLFDLSHVALETACLLGSSFTAGMAGVATMLRRPLWTQAALAVTFALGAAFIGLEAAEFSGLIAQGAGPARSAFLSAFYMLVGMHGLHVSAGLVWLAIMIAQVATRGYQAPVLRRLLCFNLFWHALDIVWVALFSIVYLQGVAS